MQFQPYPTDPNAPPSPGHTTPKATEALAAPMMNPNAARSHTSLVDPRVEELQATGNGYGGPPDANLHVDSIPRRGHQPSASVGSFTSFLSSSPPSFAHDDPHAEQHLQAGDDSGAAGIAPPVSPMGGDEFSLPSPADGGNAHYPGVVMSGPGLGFDDVKLDADSMADILDPAAASSGQPGPKAAGANIAPWLEEDEPPSPSSTPSQSSLRPPYPSHAETMPPSLTSSASTSTTHVDRREKKSHLSHFPSVPNIPRILHRHHHGSTSQHKGSGDDFLQPYPLGASTQASSSTSFFNDGTITPTSYNSHKARSIIGGRESPIPPVPDRAGSVASTGGHHHRLRFGSTATTAMSSSSGASTYGDSHSKKKGFLGNFLRRKTGSAGASSPQLPPDFMPPSRVVTTGSISTQGSSLRNQSVSTQGTVSPTATWSARSNSIQSDANVSPLHAPQEEDDEPELFLNTNLDDMEGIVDPNIANQPRPAVPLPTSNVGGEMGLADALHHTSSFAYGNGTVGPTNGRAIVEQAGGPSAFTRPNPFMSYSSGSASGSEPPSPFTVSPKTSIPNAATNAPRRPSQLRNVKINSVDSEGSDVSSLQPLAPSWAQGMQPPPNMFKDPFGSVSSRTTQRADGAPVSPSRSTIAPGSYEGAGSSQSHGYAPAIPPHNGTAAASSSAAWAAPESWGVEADGPGQEEEDTTSSSDSDSEWVESTESVVTPGCCEGTDPMTVPDGAGASGVSTPRAARGSHQGHHHHHRHRPKTSGLHHDKSRWVSDATASVPHFIRIYRADGSYTVLSFPIGTTTSELISSLSGGEASTKMKLYIRERGQDRQLLSSERPLALQARRLLQAGYTEAEHLEEIGKDDLSMLCRFIYQTPVLPIMNPEEESSYESFEFIDLSGRDLQVIPIFLHLHADNIIILNVSRNPMTDLPLDFIQACTSLKELRMSNMALKKIPASLPASTTLTRLDLSCNRIAGLESAHLCDIQTLLSLKVQNNRLSSIPTYFTQMHGLKYLNISNNVFDEFPAVICQMSNLMDLDVSFNRITELPAELSNLRTLERLICVGNELTEFPETFVTLENLRVLDVRRNKLIDLAPAYALRQLEVLRADSNDLVTLDTELGPRIKDFSVPHNSITGFTLASVTGMAYSLTNLNLSHGKLSSLAESALSELVNLVELNLSFNQFTRLPQTLDRLVNLEIFSCTDNTLDSLPENCFGNMQRLRICNIHNNNLKNLPDDVWNCGAIESINLSSNLLVNWPSPQKWYEAVASDPQRKMSTVSALSSKSKSLVPPAGESLTHLFLCDNKLNDDVFDQIALFGNLRVLNLSFNAEILEVPAYTLCHCQRLEALYLSGNKLTSLPSEDLEQLKNLRVLHLNGNKLQTLPSELGHLKHLEHLDVGSNVLKYNIANWPYDWNWNWNTALRYLNLSGNKRLEIKPTSGQEMYQHAGGPRRELSNFSSLSHLQVLGLMDVTLRIPVLPDESDEKRVRTSFSNINNMAYGISDMLGSVDHLAMFDLAVPNFRGSPDECIFGMFGRAAPSIPAGKIPKYVQEHFAIMLAEQLRALQPDEATTEALRRSFLYINKATFDALSGNDKRHRDSNGSLLTMGLVRKGPSIHTQLRTGASAAVVYMRGKELYVANAGDTLVVISSAGRAELLSKRHDPTDREETARIRRAEAWVSTKGFVNDDKEIEISRAFGFYQALPAVNASPETKSRQLNETDEFIIIGNSALWKCCPYQTAVDIARTEAKDPMMAAQKLRDFAISYGAEGSVMVMVVNVADLFVGAGPQADKALDEFSVKQRAPRRRIEEVGDRTLNRLQQEIEPPTGQVAIVFTDIVNSTALWETNPGMPTAIKMHHSLMRRRLRLDGGYEVKTEGDSFMVSFQSVTAALLWAFNCQIGLLQLEWPRELLESEDGKMIFDSQGNVIHRGLRVRMGVHWGAPECERDPITRRMDYYGPMVNRAARINASADGGQLMASQDVINEIRKLREYIESSDEHSLDELDPVVKRDVLELRRIGGLDIKDMGERKLKGLEVPEKLSLLYPKALSGRLELFTGLRANVEVNNDSRIFASDQDIEDARALANITLRLESLCALQAPVESKPPSPTTPYSDPRLSMIAGTNPGALTPGARMSISIPPLASMPANAGHSTTAKRGSGLNPVPNPHLGPAIRDNMTEDEFVEVVGSLTTRIENCLSTLYLKHLGGFASVLAALEQATHIDKGMLVHALSLMSGHMGGASGATAASASTVGALGAAGAANGAGALRAASPAYRYAYTDAYGPYGPYGDSQSGHATPTPNSPKIGAV